jgi:signal transduction histidine kinase
MTRRLGSRTWPVFLVGLGSLLALLFLPGITSLRRTAVVYREVRATQEAYRYHQRVLSEIERRLYLISIQVREMLLDTSSGAAARYRAAFEHDHSDIDQQLRLLERRATPETRGAIAKLRQTLADYFAAISPVFSWTREERAGRALYFLREQQRPRRQAVIAVASEIGRLADAAYAAQLEQINRSQTSFGEDIQRVILAAFLIGAAIAATTALRIRTLEARARRQRAETERAEDELRRLSTMLMHAQEQERKTISRELHDEVGQLLTGLRMSLGALERIRLERDEFNTQLGEVKMLSEQALRTVRDIAVGLRPSVLDLGLVPAVQWQARRFSKYASIPVNVTAHGNLDGIPEDLRTCMYRAVQECLTNAAKHSGAKSIRVELREQQGCLDVRVQDDGNGFLPQQRANGGLGLLGIEERVRELGGSLTIDSAPGGGATVVVRLPLAQTSARVA